MKSTKGQVTVFIIIGIILVLVSLFTYYLIQRVTVQEVTASGRPILERVPQEFQPIQTFTESCIQSTGEIALLLLGQQGGYIDPGVAGRGEFSATNPTEGDGLLLGDLRVPYWHFNSAPNTGNKVVFSSHQPSLHQSGAELSIEGQLNSYIEAHLPECLSDYQLFLQQGFDVQRGDIDTKTTVTDQGVQFLVEMPLELRKGESIASPELFYAETSLKLKKMYQVADTITNVQQNSTFLERQGLDLVGLYSGIDVQKLPPTTGLTFELIPSVRWTEWEVQQRLQGLLTSYVPLLRFFGSQNFVRYEYLEGAYRDLNQQIYDNTILPLYGGEDVEITFDYFGWTPYFDANDRGGIIQPEHTPISHPFLEFGVQRYRTTYDLSYPVLVTVHDPLAFDGRGYTFMFALEANVRNNEVARPDATLPPTRSTFEESMVCDQDKRETGLLSLRVIDSSTDKPLSNVAITFVVPEQNTCTLGQTNGEGSFENTYPAVYGGIINFVKKDYLTNFYPIDTYPFKGRTGIIGRAVSGSPEPVLMHPFKTIPVRIMKKNIEKCIMELEDGEEESKNCYYSSGFGGGFKVFSAKTQIDDDTEKQHEWYYTGVTQPLDAYEQAVVTLTRKGDVQEGIFQSESSHPISVRGDESVEVQLVPGVYEVNGVLLKNKEIVIPKEERCGGGFLGLGEDCLPLDGTRMEQFPAGALLWNSSRTYLTITPEQLYGSNEMTLYIPNQHIENVPAEEHIRVLEDLQVFGEMYAFSQKEEIWGSLQPVFR